MYLLCSLSLLKPRAPFQCFVSRGSVVSGHFLSFPNRWPRFLPELPSQFHDPSCLVLSHPTALSSQNPLPPPSLSYRAPWRSTFNPYSSLSKLQICAPVQSCPWFNLPDLISSWDVQKAAQTHHLLLLTLPPPSPSLIKLSSTASSFT